MPTREEIARQALTLSPEDRAYVADVLERSLDSGPFATPEIAEAWSREIDRRLAAYDRGETKAVDLEISAMRLREAFKARRGGGGWGQIVVHMRWTRETDRRQSDPRTLKGSNLYIPGGKSSRWLDDEMELVGDNLTPATPAGKLRKSFRPPHTLKSTICPVLPCAYTWYSGSVI